MKQAGPGAHRDGIATRSSVVERRSRRRRRADLGHDPHPEGRRPDVVRPR